MSIVYMSSILAMTLAIFSCGKALKEKATHLRGDPIDIAMLRRSGDSALLQDMYSRELLCHVDMIGVRGEYTFTANQRDAQTVCATYLLTEPSDVVEIEFTEFNVDCNDASNQLQFFDGWTMGVGSFPSAEDHTLPMEERILDVCAQRNRVFRSNQNGAMITFKLGQPGASFRIAFRPVHNAEPCNVIAPEQRGSHTIRNYGNERNCSFTIIYPSTVHILEMSVGGQDSADARLRCHVGLDYVELLEGNSLDLSGMRREESICGQVGSLATVNGDGSSRSGNNQIVPGAPTCEPRAISIPLMCHNSMARLVSSNQHENHVSLQFNRLNIARSECPEDV